MRDKPAGRRRVDAPVKWVFLATIVFLAPVLAALLRAHKQYLIATSFMIGLLMFVVAPWLWAAPIPWPGWPGYVQGLIVSFLDSVALAVIFATRPVHVSRFVV